MQASRVARIAACLSLVAVLQLASSGGLAVAQGSKPKALAFVVDRVDRRPAGEFIVTFENGEVWQQAKLDHHVDIKRGDQVVIRKAALGKFMLVSRDGQSTEVIRTH